MSPHSARTLRLGFIGGGNMAEALIRGLLQQSRYAPSQIIVSDISSDRTRHLHDTYGIAVTASNAETAAEADIVILAVKPQHIGVVRECRNAFNGKLVMSIAAGISINTLENLCGSARLARVMPNTPALIGAGVSAFVGSPSLTQEDLEEVRGIFSAVGKVVELPGEHLMDAVTGLSGSGPAYVFLFIEALADGAVKAGLPRHLALELAAETVSGAARLVAESGKHPGELKDMVASPGGTTIAGVHVLEKQAFRGAVASAVEEAAKRSAELSKNQA